jgi:hypothetical protein
MKIDIQIANTATPELQAIAGRLANPAAIHAAIAGSSERFLKKFGAARAKEEHRTATRLGAKPTGHLVDAYNRIESGSDTTAARLFIPAASRLRAAFGTYTVRPTEGRKWLTIPITAEAYGKRAREIDGLAFIFNQETTTALLIKRNGDGTYKPYYLLVKQVTIPEDAGLIPFDDLAQNAADAAELYLIQGGTPP